MDISDQKIKEFIEYKRQEEHKKLTDRMISFTKNKPTLTYTHEGRCIPIKIARLWMDQQILNINKSELMTIAHVTEPPKNIMSLNVINTANDMLRYLISNYTKIKNVIPLNKRPTSCWNTPMLTIIWQTFFHLIGQHNMIYNKNGITSQMNIDNAENSNYKAFVIDSIPKLSKMQPIESVKFIKYMLTIWDQYDEGAYSYACRYAFGAYRSVHGEYVFNQIKPLPCDIDQDLLDIMINVR